MMENTDQSQVYDSSERDHPVEELRSILKYRHLLVQLVGATSITRYKRSGPGVAWTMLNR
jgi:ABC-type polysaccharide/polyol phosphate export permease